MWLRETPCSVYHEGGSTLAARGGVWVWLLLLLAFCLLCNFFPLSPPSEILVVPPSWAFLNSVAWISWLCVGVPSWGWAMNLWSVKAATAGAVAFYLLRFNGLFLCLPLFFSLFCEFRLCCSGGSRTQSHIFKMPKFMYGVRIYMMTPVF